MEITLAIPTWNRAEVLRRTLRSLEGMRVPDGVEAELLVVDNNSPDHTADVVRECAARLPFPVRRVVETAQGLNHSRNRVVAESRAHVAFLDDDIEVAPTWIEGYAEAVNSLGAECVVGPVVPEFPAGADALHADVLRSLSSPYSARGDRPCVVRAEDSHEVPGCNFGMPRAVAKATGGFHPMLDRSAEGLLAGGDTEFGLRLRKAARRVVYHPACGIRHIIPPGKLDAGYLRRRYRGAGLTSAILVELHPWAFDARRWRHANRKAFLALACRWIAALLGGRRAEAFRHELELRRIAALLHPAGIDFGRYRQAVPAASDQEPLPNRD